MPAAAEVRALLSGQNVRLHEGLFPATVAGLEEERYACAHIDADLYQSTADAIAYFWPRMLPGALLVFDDVDWKDTPGVNRALAEARLLNQIERPAQHQGWISKPPAH